MTFSCVGVVGSGPVGCAIAIAVARVDVPVVLVRATRGEGGHAARRIEARLRYFLEAGEMNEEEVVRARGGIRLEDDLAVLGGCDLVIESVSGDERARRAVLATLEPRLSSGSVLASNSPPESLPALAEVLRRHDQFVGMSFFSGAAADAAPRRDVRPSLPSKRLVQLGLLADTAPGVAQACKAFARDLGTTTIERATGVANVGYREFLSGENATLSPRT